MRMHGMRRSARSRRTYLSPRPVYAPAMRTVSRGRRGLWAVKGSFLAVRHERRRHGGSVPTSGGCGRW